MNINDIQDEIIEEFSSFDDWMDRYSLLIDYGNGLEPFPEVDKNDKNLIDGCQSKVWFTAEMRDGKVFFHGDSDAILVKGIVRISSFNSSRLGLFSTTRGCSLAAQDWQRVAFLLISTPQSTQ